MPTTAAPPTEPTGEPENAASPKLKTPPSSATSQYPPPSEVAVSLPPPGRSAACHPSTRGTGRRTRHPPVGRHQPVATRRTGGDPGDGAVEVAPAHRAVEGGIAVGEDAAVGGHQPVAAAVRGGGDADAGPFEVAPALEPWKAASP